MPLIPSRLRRPDITKIQAEAEERAFTKAATAVRKSFLGGNAATMPGSPSGTGTGVSLALQQRVTTNLSNEFQKTPDELEQALQDQGLSWGPAFPPGRPLNPFAGYRQPARTWNYSVGENVQITPRWNRVSFNTLKALYDNYDVAQICVRHLINDVRSLEYSWQPLPGNKEDVTSDLEAAAEFFDSPDKRQPFRAWCAEYLQDVLRYDAGTLYVRENMMGDPIALEVVSGSTIIPLIDYYGRRPEDEDDAEATYDGQFEGDVVPAYVQIIEGMPWIWFTDSDIIYQPFNPLPESQYGLAPLEGVLITANTDLRFQWHFLQYFTEGSIPAGFMTAPPDQSDPAQIQEWQEMWNDLMLGDQSKLNQIRWVPSDSKFQPIGAAADKFDQQFPLYLMRRVAAAFGVTPNDLGFTDDVNRSTGDTQIDVQFRVGTRPLLRHLEDVINIFVKERLKLKCRLKFLDGRETEDRVGTAQAMGIYLDHGVVSTEEVRLELGYAIDAQRPVGRYINNTRVGPIPLLALESMAGKIDNETFAPARDQALVDTPFAAPAGVIPPAGSPELMASSQTTAQQARDLQSTSTGKPPVVTPPPASNGTPAVTAPDAAAGGQTAAAPVAKDLILDTIRQIDEILALKADTGADNTGGPGVHPTEGITTATGIQGKDLLDDEDDDEDDEAQKALEIALALRRWRDNSRTRIRKGLVPRRFSDPSLPPEIHNQIWSALHKAQNREEVDAVFADLGKAAAGNRPASTGTPTRSLSTTRR
jgi:hypothetical protein